MQTEDSPYRGRTSLHLALRLQSTLHVLCPLPLPHSPPTTLTHLSHTTLLCSLGHYLSRKSFSGHLSHTVRSIY